MEQQGPLILHAQGHELTQELTKCGRQIKSCHPVRKSQLPEQQGTGGSRKLLSRVHGSPQAGICGKEREAGSQRLAVSPAH